MAGAAADVEKDLGPEWPGGTAEAPAGVGVAGVVDVAPDQERVVG